MIRRINMKKLVAYFSASGTTQKVAEKLAKVVDGDLFEIIPKTPYTDADLNWLDKKSRTSVEMGDKSSRPEIEHNTLDTSKYDVVFLGFPIWWYVAPTIINTFLESYDFSNKTIILFATSGGSGFGQTVKFLQPSVSRSTTIREGKLLNGNPSEDTLTSWVNSLNL